MPRPKRPLADADVNVGVPPKNNARKARKTEHSSAADTKYAQVVTAPSLLRWLRGLTFLVVSEYSARK